VFFAVVSFVAGLFAWTFVEYLIHGWMSHVFVTFATPLHDVHHRDPAAVFTLGAWLPALLLWIAGFALLGPNSPMIVYTGLLVGFVSYEIIHYRMHYVAPSSALERRLRTRHLVHHFRAPDRCFGVTSALWDRVFGTEPSAQQMEQLSASVRGIAPLRTPTNLARVLRFGGRAV
jgi:dihydroceramide fatty acyl 2-hydroxylase